MFQQISQRLKYILLVVIFFGEGSKVFALDLNEYLQRVKASNKSYLAAEKNAQAIERKRVGADLELNPITQIKWTDVSDKKQPNQLGSTETKMGSASVSYLQKLKTGTDLQFSLASSGYENIGLSNPAFSAFRQYSQGSLGVSLQQALWKNQFGNSTQLRQQRDMAIYQMETSGIEAEKVRILIEAEQTFWDYIYLSKELELKKSSVARAQKIESWMSRRLKDGIVDEADYLSTQALVEARTLEMISTQDELKATEVRLRDQLELSSTEVMPVLEADLEEGRTEVFSEKKSHQRLRRDALLGHYEVELKKLLFLEKKEFFKPDLSLLASFSTNGYAPGGGLSDGTRDIAKTDTPTTTLGLSLSYQWDSDVKKAALETAQSESISSELKYQRKILESSSAWVEIQRRYQELSRRVGAAQKLTQIQMRRAQLEGQKLSRGRSITSQVITAEQDADEAAVRLNKLRVEQRKLESQAQNFVAIGRE